MYKTDYVTAMLIFFPAAFAPVATKAITLLDYIKSLGDILRVTWTSTTFIWPSYNRRYGSGLYAECNRHHFYGANSLEDRPAPAGDNNRPKWGPEVALRIYTDKSPIMLTI